MVHRADRHRKSILMTEQQHYRVIADRASMADESWIAEGDRVTYGSVSSTGELVIVRIERPMPTTDEQQRRFRVVDIDQGVIDEGNNEVTFTLSELDEQHSPSLPTREQIAEMWDRARDDTSIPRNRDGEMVPVDAFQAGVAAVLALLQKGAEREWPAADDGSDLTWRERNGADRG